MSRCSRRRSPASSDLLVCAHLPGLRPRLCPPHYLLSLCEYFALLLPLVRDAWDWVLIVFPWCGHCGMRLPDVWCVVTGVWPLTPSWPPACLPVRLHLTGGDMAAPTHTDTHTRACLTLANVTLLLFVLVLSFFFSFFVHAKLHYTQRLEKSPCQILYMQPAYLPFFFQRFLVGFTLHDHSESICCICIFF